MSASPVGRALAAIGWDHPRCVRPMSAAASRWEELTGVPVRWEFRPLSAFNDQPIAELARAYDVLVIDHPAIPEAVAAGVLAPLEELIDAGTLTTLSDDAVGDSADSYRHQGSAWALPVDAACQVSAIRRDRIDLVDTPATWHDALAAVQRLGTRAALPLLPADALCALLTLSATLGEPVGLERPVSVAPLELLARLCANVHSSSWACSPPALLDLMRDDDEIAYVPLTFGYVTHVNDHVRFIDAPSSAAGRRRPVLGGAGLAISAFSGLASQAADFCTWICGAEAQHQVVLANGGQPASRNAWLAADPRSAADEFFAATRTSIESAWVRPKHPAWAAFQRDAAQVLVDGLRGGDTPEAISEQLWQLAGRLTSQPSAA